MQGAGQFLVEAEAVRELTRDRRHFGASADGRHLVVSGERFCQRLIRLMDEPTDEFRQGGLVTHLLDGTQDRLPRREGVHIHSEIDRSGEAEGVGEVLKTLQHFSGHQPTR